MYPTYSRRLAERGHTVAELVVVVAIIALAAAVALPQLDDTDDATLDYVANEVAAAFRFARAEAMRTGTPHGAHVDNDSVQRVRLYWLDTSGTDPVAVYDVRHPLTKELYELRFDGEGMPEGSTIHEHSFYFGGSATSSDYMGFSGRGVPKITGSDSGSSDWWWCWWCGGGGSGGSSGDDMLDYGSLELRYGAGLRKVRIAPNTGRVTVL